MNFSTLEIAAILGIAAIAICSFIYKKMQPTNSASKNVEVGESIKKRTTGFCENFLPTIPKRLKSTLFT